MIRDVRSDPESTAAVRRRGRVTREASKVSAVIALPPDAQASRIGEQLGSLGSSMLKEVVTADSSAIGATGRRLARSINLAVGSTRGDYVLIADGRAVLAPTTSPTWLSDALTALQRDGVAAVGGEVRDRSGRWLQAGLRPDLGPLSGLLFDPAVRPPLADATCNPLAVCAAPMLVSRSILEALGGFDEDRFPDALFDVDLALRATRRGLRNVYIPSLTVRVPVVRTAPEAEIARFIRTWL